jgi:hypothetical protein
VRAGRTLPVALQAFVQLVAEQIEQRAMPATAPAPAGT